MQRGALWAARPTPHGLPPPPPLRSWNAFFKNIDEDLVKQQADLMVSLGLRDAGCAAAASLPPAAACLWAGLAEQLGPPYWEATKPQF